MPLVSKYIDFLSVQPLPLKSMEGACAVRDNKGEIVRYNGSRGVVVKLAIGNREYAAKFFTHPNSDLVTRYNLLKKLKLPFAPDFRLSNDEIKLYEYGATNSYPALYYPWVDGVSLDMQMRHLASINDKNSLSLLRDKVIDIFIQLLNTEVVHGDIKPENIICGDNGEVYLIDWDCLYHKEIDGVSSTEIGSEGYRRNNRVMEHYGGRLDDYPIALIAINLIAVADNPQYMRGHSSSGELYDIFSANGRYTKEISDRYIYYSPYKELIDFILGDKMSLPSLLLSLLAIRGKLPYDSNYYEVIDKKSAISRVVDIGSKRYGYVDRATNLITIYPSYGDATLFYNGIAAVKLNSSWYFINSAGDRITDDLYSVIQLRDGAFKIKKSVTDEYIDISGF